MKKKYTFSSADKKTNIHVIVWYPENETIGVVQIAHGMVEFIDRYERFASFLAQHGYVVVGNDHLGHGKSIKSGEELGFFRQPGGNEAVISDMRKLHLITRKHFPQVPYFLIGHSMGSFFTREYIELFGQDLTGAVIVGTGSQPKGMLKMGKGLCSTIAAFRGWKHRSLIVDYICFGNYNRKFEPARTNMDWLTRDEEIVDAYKANPLNNFRFTMNGYYSMFTAIEAAENPKKIGRIPKSLPLLLVSGTDDPVGGFGDGVRKAYESYKKAGLNDVQMHLFESDRHEILNELNHSEVYRYILDWLNERNSRSK